MNSVSFRGAVAGVLLGLTFAGAAIAGSIPTQPESGTLSFGVQPWLGYGPIYIAANKGFFKQVGLSDVKLQNFSEQKDINAAMASGTLDIAAVPTNAALSMKAAGLPIKIVALLDFSIAADAILAGPDIKTVADFRGKKVAYEQGATSDVLINYALGANGMSLKDIQPVPMPAANAGAALIAGQVPIAVTYEPYISTVRAQNNKLHLVYTAGVDPGLISDVFVVTDDALAKKPGQILAAIKAWDLALKDYERDVPAGRAIIAKALGSAPSELNSAFNGVKFYSVADNKTFLGGTFAHKTLKDVSDACVKGGLLDQPVSAEGFVITDFIRAAP
jgi:NitT/TauT family transport system substrate-binding protein